MELQRCKQNCHDSNGTKTDPDSYRVIMHEILPYQSTVFSVYSDFQKYKCLLKELFEYRVIVLLSS